MNNPLDSLKDPGLLRVEKDNLFAGVQYDRAAWERIQRSLDQWAR